MCVVCKKQGRYVLGLGSFKHCFFAFLMEFLIRTEKVDESAPEKVKFLFSEKSLAEESRKLEVSFKSGRSKELIVPSTVYF